MTMLFISSRAGMNHFSPCFCFFFFPGQQVECGVCRRGGASRSGTSISLGTLSLFSRCGMMMMLMMMMDMMLYQPKACDNRLIFGMKQVHLFSVQGLRFPTKKFKVTEPNNWGGECGIMTGVQSGSRWCCPARDRRRHTLTTSRGSSSVD